MLRTERQSWRWASETLRPFDSSTRLIYILWLTPRLARLFLGWRRVDRRKSRHDGHPRSPVHRSATLHSSRNVALLVARSEPRQGPSGSSTARAERLETTRTDENKRMGDGTRVADPETRTSVRMPGQLLRVVCSHLCRLRNRTLLRLLILHLMMFLHCLNTVLPL